MSKLPKWQRRHIQQCRAAFGIGHSGFELVATAHDTPGGEANCAGEATTSARYHRAELVLRRGLPARDGPGGGYEILTHETLHGAMGEQRQAVSRIIELVPEELRVHAEELWQDGNEATVTRLARALTPVLRAVDRRKESG